MEPQIKYARTSDGVSIAYWTMGEGDPPLVMSPPLAWSHISLEMRIPKLASWYEHLASRRTLIRFDPRGMGLSDRGVERLSEADLTSDIEAVLERFASSQVDLVGFFGSGAPMVRIAAAHGQLIRRLVLWGVSILGKDFFSTDRLMALRGLIKADWELFTETFASVTMGWTSKEARQWARFTRSAVDKDDAARILDALAQTDWRPWLERIGVPTLVIRDDRSVPQSAVRWSDIADVRLVEVHDNPSSHESPTGRAALDAFFGVGTIFPQIQSERISTSGTAIILFADIVDSTALTERLGDAAFREKARDLDAALRALIRDHSGTPIEGKLLGDGVLATFASARQAIEAALACGAAGDEGGLPLHLGLHAGDVIREEGNVFGGAVNIAARIAGESAAGEVLVSQTVRDLARTSAGPSVEGFEDCGERGLKGVSEPVRVWRVLEGEA